MHRPASAIDESLGIDIFHTIGLALSQGGLPAMAARLADIVVERLGCSYAEVTVAGAAERRLAVAGLESGEPRMRWLLLPAREPLYLRVDGPLDVCARAEALMRAVQPWLRAIATPSPRLAVAPRLDSLCQRWRLSKKQGQILRELGLGMSNKEVAQRLNCSIKTVEAHVTEILRRSGLGSRGALLQTVWAGDPDAPP